MDDETQVVSQETQVVPEDSATEEPVTPQTAPEGQEPAAETEQPGQATPALAEVLGQLRAVQGKLDKSVAAEKSARSARQAAEAELTGFREQRAAAEAERVTKLSLEEKLAEAVTGRQAAEAEMAKVTSAWTDYRVETDLERGGFLAGLEGEAKTSQLETLRALTSLSLVQGEEGFSIEKFSQRFASLKPTPSPAVTPQVVVDLGGKTAPPNEVKASRRNELMQARQAAIKGGDRMQVINLENELALLAKRG